MAKTKSYDKKDSDDNDELNTENDISAYVRLFRLTTNFTKKCKEESP